MRGATTDSITGWETVRISIHAPRAGSDCNERYRQIPESYFNPRSPCGERRKVENAVYCNCLNFNPRSPCGERQRNPRCMSTYITFQSTLPVRERLNPCPLRGYVLAISIHAPRAGSDVLCPLSCRCSRHFNPRSPCGERRRATRSQRSSARFQSTLPVRGATRSIALRRNRSAISIHAPRAGSDDKFSLLL